ncbi:MAG: aminoglycoside 6-adenylyltransferase, partial [Actinomycetota bacterium]
VAYAEYLERLVATLGADEHVVGAVALGSTAATVREPDRWSDHDLWVIVRPGSEEQYRTDPSWLPDSGRLLLWLRETRHGMKAVYDDGHLVEVAVFRLDELEVARVNTYRVLLDKGGVAAALPAVREATEAHLDRVQRSEGYLVGQFVTGLLVGIGRYARGEWISGHEFVKVHAVGHLLALLPLVLEPADPDAVDDLNPWRRVEQAFPDMAARISAALAQDVPAATLGLLATAETLRPLLADWPAGVAAVVRRLASEQR